MRNHTVIKIMIILLISASTIITNAMQQQEIIVGPKQAYFIVLNQDGFNLYHNGNEGNVLPVTIPMKKAKIVCHPYNNTVFCVPTEPSAWHVPDAPEEYRRAGIILDGLTGKQVGIFAGVGYRECVEQAFFSVLGTYFVLVAGAHYPSSACSDIVKIKVIDSETFNIVDDIAYRGVVSAQITMNNNDRYLRIPKKQGGFIVHDVEKHKRAS